MDVTVKLYAGLRKYLPEDIRPGQVKLKKSFPEGLTVGDLLKTMKIPPQEVMFILVNSEDIMESGGESEYELHEGAIVELFPPMLGG